MIMPSFFYVNEDKKINAWIDSGNYLFLYCSSKNRGLKIGTF
jgi:hypothetical protein